MKLSDLVSIRAIPAVVQADDVRDLRVGNSEATRDFVRGYLGFDDRSRAALDLSVRSLAAPDGKAASGGAWFFNGVFGSGKSHLLGVLALLCDGSAHEDFGVLHPHLATALGTFTPRLVVHFSLDQYPASQFGLEEIFWREVRTEWARRELPENELKFPDGVSRGETFAMFEDALRTHDLNGVVVCLDELSLFLSGREHRALQNDAAWLQFLGQRARRRTANAPLWIFAALQKTVEDIGDLDAYAISQIRDRFTTLPLSLAHLPSLIEQRLVRKIDEKALRELCGATYDSLLRALPRLDFGRDEWQRLYPFHPATVSLLESLAARYGSRTRSAVVFCSQALDENADAHARIAPDTLFDFWESELGAHPDLKPLLGVWQAWQTNLDEIASDASEKTSLRSLMKALILWKIAGTPPSVIQLANALNLDAGLPGESNYKYARILLEKLRECAGSLAVERRDDPLLDRYSLDFGARLGEMARRFTHNALHTLPPGDRRIAAHVALCCRDENFPLAALQNAASVTTLWRNTPRAVRLELAAAPPAPDVLANRFAALQAPGGDAFALWIVPPFLQIENREDNEAPNAVELWREAMRAAVAETNESRWRGALVRWIPRVPSADEWQVAREATAQHLLQSDPQLHDNRRGRAVLEFLKNGAAEREATLSHLAGRLLREGTLASAAGAVLEASELAASDNWNATLESLAEWVLPVVHPRFEDVAPRLRVLTSANAEALCLEILRRPTDAPYFAASLERAVRALAEPLGIAVADRGRWKIASPQSELAQAMRAQIENGATLSAIEAHFEKSAWGLDAEQTRLMICALLRGGEIAALDARGAQLVPNQIGMPLRRAVHSLRAGRLLDDAAWQAVQNSGVLLGAFSEDFGVLSFAAQDAAHAKLLAWRDDQTVRLQLAQARLHQLRRALGAHNAWPHVDETREKISQLLQSFNGDSAYDFLMRAANAPPDSEVLEEWRVIEDKLENRHAALLEAHAFLTHDELVTPPELAEERAQLLTRLVEGEHVLDDATLLQQCATWREKYAGMYAHWHAAQNDAARWISVRRLATSDELASALKLGTLAHRDFAFARETQDAISSELGKACVRSPRAENALREPACSACRLKMNQRVAVRDVREIAALLQNGANAFRAALSETSVADFLARDKRGAQLLQWQGDDKSLAALSPILDAATLRFLDEAFRPRRRAERRISVLLGQFESCRTRAQFEGAFASWLGGDEGLQSDDEIVLQ